MLKTQGCDKREAVDPVKLLIAPYEVLLRFLMS
jgi:hypothetical protein